MSIVASVMKKLHTRKILKIAEKNMKKDGAYKIVKHINKKTGVVSLIGKTKQGEKYNSFGLLSDGSQISKSYAQLLINNTPCTNKIKTIRTVVVGADGHRYKKEKTIKKFLELTRVPVKEMSKEIHMFKTGENFFMKKVS